MTITCAHCGCGSTVVESRQRVFAVKPSRGGGTNTNIIRLRQCLNCRWRWKTIERTVKKSRYKLKESQCPSPAASNPTPTA